MKNFKVSKKLMVSFGIVLGLFLAVILITSISLDNVSGKLSDFYNGSYKNVQSASRIGSTLQEIAKNMLHAAMTTDTNETQNRLDMANEAFKNIEADLHIYKPISMATPAI